MVYPVSEKFAFTFNLMIKKYHPYIHRSLNRQPSSTKQQINFRYSLRTGVPVRHERNSGRAKDFFAFEPREKWGESITVEEGGGGGEKSSPPPPLSLHLFALAPTFAQPFCSRPILRAARMRKNPSRGPNFARVERERLLCRLFPLR